MEVLLKTLLFLTATVHLSSAVTHSYQYFYTAVTPGIDFPEFTALGLVDGKPINYYDNKIGKMIPKGDWITKNGAVDPDYWNRNTQNLLGTQEVFKAGVDILMKRFNQTKGVHTVQVMYGCELDDDGTKRGYNQHGYDGEDFLSLDLKTETWIAPVSQAVPTKQKWDRTGNANFRKNYLENECIEWLQKYVGYGRSTLERKVRPEVDLFQSDSPSSPVVCHATAFFPSAVMISWQKNGEDVYGDVDLRETVPNHDGTFQKRSILTVSPEDLEKHQYTCVVQHSSLEKEMVLQVSNRRILSDEGGVRTGEGGVALGPIVGGVLGVLLLIIVCVGVFVWKKNNGFKPVPGSDGDSSNNSLQIPVAKA